MPSFDIYETFQSHPPGGAWVGANIQQILVPEPDAGMVRVPLLANIQNDGGVKSPYYCHGILRRTASPLDPAWTWTLSSPSCILWARKLTTEAMVGGEFFFPVDVFPLPRGFEIYAEWSDASGAHCHRTRCVSVQVPAAGFDWTRAATNFGQYRFITP